MLGSSLGARLRKISGNASEGATSSAGSHSLREIRYLRAGLGVDLADGGDWRGSSSGGGGGGGGGEERVVFVSAEKKVPFAIGSVLPFSKSSKNPHHRWVYGFLMSCTSLVMM